VALDWTAYNDLSWYAGQLATNITTITSPTNTAGLPSSGELIDYATGTGTGVTLTVTGGNHLASIQGAEATTGDAFSIFNGIVSTLGVISYVNAAPPGGNLVLTLEGMDSGTTYELVFHGQRDNYAWDRAALATISDVDTFTNQSSVATDNPTGAGGTLFDGPTDDSTRLPSANPNGYVARFLFDPGADGDAVLTISFDGTAGNEYAGKYASALALTGSFGACTDDNDCDDLNDCTDDTCNVGTGLCEFVGNDLNLCTDDNDCTDDACVAGSCVSTPNDLNPCTDGVDCTDDACSGGFCLGTDNCIGGQVCNETTGVCETPQVILPGDVIIAGFQAANTAGTQSPAEFISLFNTTDSVISLEGMQIITRVGVDCPDDTCADWTLGPDLPGESIQPNSFFLIGEPGVAAPGGLHDLELLIDLATGEGGSSGTAIGIEVSIDGVIVDHVLYGRHDGTSTGDNAPGDLPFDGVSFPRDEVIRNTTTTTSFLEGVVQRLSDEDLYAGFDVEGFYTDEDTLGSGLPNGVWTSPHSNTVGTYEARNSLSPPVLPPIQIPCTSDAECDDDNVCNGLETCPVDVCVSGTPLNCDDSEPCTDDSCDAILGCSNDPNTDPCDDDDACTSGDVCSGGFCTSGAAVDCDDGAACTDDFCDSVLGCQNVDNCPAGETCNLGTGFCEEAPTVATFQEGQSGYSGTEDTFIAEALPTNVNGGLEVFEWDLEDPAPNSNTAMVQFTGIFGLGGGQIPPGGGDPGATAGDEYDAVILDTALGTPAGPQTVDVTTSLQAWSDGSSTNNGWLFVPTGIDGTEVRSSEYAAVPTERPKLTVEYLSAQAEGQMSCLLSSTTASSGGTVGLEVFLENLGSLPGVRGYQTQIRTTSLPDKRTTSR
jgi:hypothetical protein